MNDIVATTSVLAKCKLFIISITISNRYTNQS